MKQDQPNLPKHVGIILDGNRRWARANGQPILEGHRAGYQNLRKITRYMFFEKGIKLVSAFVFSTENWSRSAEEVEYLMNLLLGAFKKSLKEFKEENIRIVVLGRRDRLSPKIIKVIEQAEAETENNSAGTIAFCFNYGGQAEIVDAAKALLEQKTDPAKLTPESFADHLYHPDVPPVDLLIRTSGEQRTSGFMLWRAAYAELYFTDKHWPDFSPADVDAALADFAKRQRRYGR